MKAVGAWVVRHRISLAIWSGVGAVLLTSMGPGYAERLGGLQINPHWPDAAMWAAAPFKVKLHIFAAVTAFAIGAVILLKPKGTGFHRTLGWAWAVAMGATGRGA
jgi:hypothetical protein